MIQPAAEEYSTTNTVLASYIIAKTKCRYRLKRDGTPAVTILLNIPKETGEDLECDFAASEYHACRAIERTLTDKIRQK